MKALKNGRALWYGPDQDYGLNQGLFVPFFNVQAATVYATARFAEKTGAAVVPFSHIRLPGARGYKISISPPLENFPVGDDLVDTRRINQIVEEFIMLQPDQYLWVHRRFKNRPEGEPDLYQLPGKRNSCSTESNRRFNLCTLLANSTITGFYEIPLKGSSHD